MAAEPESLATTEPLESHIRRHAYDRLIMLSDGVFAIATTLAAIEIHLPESPIDLSDMVQHAGRPIIAYVLSFGLTAIFWVQHRDLFARLRRVDAPMTLMTLGMLCMIALIPATIHTVYAPGGTQAPFRFYAITMLVCGLLIFGMWTYAVLKPGIMHPDVPRLYRIGRVIASAAMPVVFVIVLVIPLEQAPFVVLPIALVLLVMRRIVMPRMIARDAAKSAA